MRNLLMILCIIFIFVSYYIFISYYIFSRYFIILLIFQYGLPTFSNIFTSRLNDFFDTS
jgi:hypothetical protein